MSKTLLRIDSSARTKGSVTRSLTDQIVAHLNPATVLTRDLAHGVPLISENWVEANFTPEAERSAEQKQILAISDSYVAEIMDADVLVIGAPLYNFSVPAALKAWVDQIARAGVTFRYTENGPQGLLRGKRAILVSASGGTKIGSEIDFATAYLRHVLGFIGISNVQNVSADQTMMTGDGAITAAQEAVTALAA